MTEMIKKMDSAFLKSLCHEYNIIAFIIFGSYASGKTNLLSDLDIAYLPDAPFSERLENKLFLKISKRLKRDDIDLVNISNAGLILKYSVIMFGKVVVCTNDKALYRFVVQTRRDYLDTAHIRSIYSYYLAKRIKLGLFGEAK